MPTANTNLTWAMRFGDGLRHVGCARRDFGRLGDACLAPAWLPARYRGRCGTRRRRVDAYFAAVQIPNLFRRLVAGELNAAFVPAWMRIRQGSGDADAFAWTVFATTGLMLGLVTLLCIVFAPVIVALLLPGFDEGGVRFTAAVTFLRLAAPYITIAGLIAVAFATLNAQGRVAAAAFSVVAFNIILLGAIAVVLILGTGTSQLTGNLLAGSIVIAGLAQFVLVAHAVPWRRRSIPKFSPELRDFYVKALPSLIASGIPQLKLIACCNGGVHIAGRLVLALLREPPI